MPAAQPPSQRTCIVWCRRPNTLPEMELPNLDTIYASQLRKKASTIIRDATHPGHSSFEPLPSGKRSGQRERKPTDWGAASIPELWPPLHPSLPSYCFFSCITFIYLYYFELQRETMQNVIVPEYNDFFSSGQVLYSDGVLTWWQTDEWRLMIGAEGGWTLDTVCSCGFNEQSCRLQDCACELWVGWKEGWLHWKMLESWWPSDQ